MDEPVARKSESGPVERLLCPRCVCVLGLLSLAARLEPAPWAVSKAPVRPPLPENGPWLCGCWSRCLWRLDGVAGKSSPVRVSFCFGTEGNCLPCANLAGEVDDKAPPPLVVGFPD